MIGKAFSDRDRDAERRLPVWQQEAPRFHGAFQGGFSAGWHGTVGSAEGFVPAQFRSSRAQRVAAAAPQTAEDFMDDEDRRELLAESLSARPEFAGLRGSSGGEKEAGKEALQQQKTAMEELFAPVQFTVGLLMLRTMGWREGRGVGADGGVAHVVDVVPKTDRHGIGFDPSASIPGFEQVRRLRAGIGAATASTAAASARKSSSSRFGLSALEDDADDIDVFAADDMRRYDVQLGGPAEPAAPKPAKKGGGVDMAPLAKSISGNLPLVGFVCAVKPLLQKKWFAAPPSTAFVANLRPGEIPYHRFDKPVQISPDLQQKMTPWMRASLLGERQLPASKASVFSLMSQEDRQRIADITGKAVPGPFRIPTLPRDLPKPATAAEPVVDTPSSTLAGQLKLPDSVLNAPMRVIYPTDMAKQRRFEQFIAQSRAGNTDVRPAAYSSDWEWNSERLEFANSALLLRPVDGALGQRFSKAASGSTVDAESSRDHGLSRVAQAQQSSSDEPSSTKKAFVKMMRSTQEWAPASLLCKRLGVTNPWPDGLPQRVSAAAAAADSRPASVTFAPTQVHSSFVSSGMLVPPTTASRVPASAPSEEEEEEEEEKEAERVEEEDDEKERPPIDLFKAIFESDEPVPEEFPPVTHTSPPTVPPPQHPQPQQQIKRERSPEREHHDGNDRKRHHHHHHHKHHHHH